MLYRSQSIDTVLSHSTVGHESESAKEDEDDQTHGGEADHTNDLRGLL